MHELAGWAAQLGGRAVWDCHTGGDSPADGTVTAGALIELRQILRDAGSDMRAAVLEENGGTHNMLRMLGHVTQNHANMLLHHYIYVMWFNELMELKCTAWTYRATCFLVRHFLMCFDVFRTI